MFSNVAWLQLKFCTKKAIMMNLNFCIAFVLTGRQLKKQIRPYEGLAVTFTGDMRTCFCVVEVFDSSVTTKNQMQINILRKWRQMKNLSKCG